MVPEAIFSPPAADNLPAPVVIIVGNVAVSLHLPYCKYEHALVVVKIIFLALNGTVIVIPDTSAKLGLGFCYLALFPDRYLCE